MYVMLGTKLDICFTISIKSIYLSNLGLEQRIIVKHILKYHRKMKDYMLMFQSNKLVPIIFTLGGTTTSWKSVKQSYIDK